MKSIYVIAILFFTTILAGCISTPDPVQVNRVDLLLNVGGLSSPLTQNSDTLIVDELKFSLDQSIFDFDNGDLQIGTSGQLSTLIFAYEGQFEGVDRLILSAPLGVAELETADNYRMEVAPVPNSALIDDRDFFGEQENFSFIMSGTYNGFRFFYTSTITFDKDFPLGSIRFEPPNETLVVTKRMNIASIVIDSEGNLLDPNLEENAAVIDSLFQESINVEAFIDNRSIM
ncbi:MAG: hypothetical protein ACNA78_04090 [Balneolaceae bacterium]